MLSKPGFLRRGVSWASLKPLGKEPWEKERLASFAIICENTEGQDLSKVVGIKSAWEVLQFNEFNNMLTSWADTDLNELKCTPLKITSANTWNEANCAILSDIYA